MPVPAPQNIGVVPESLAEKIANVLQREIISGVYEPGQRLVERELSSRFQVSSIPAREALQRLERRGLVTRRPNQGCSVIALAPGEIERICELREVLEPKVTEWASERITAEGEQRLREQLKLLEKAADSQNHAEVFYQDLQFHRIVWEISQNPFASNALDTAMGSLFACGLRDANGLDLREEFQKHERWLQAIINGPPKAASRALVEIAQGFHKHLRRTRAEGGRPQ